MSEKVAIATDKAPAAIGPYSQAIRVGQWVFCSGQIPIDPATGNLAEGDVASQAVCALDNLQAVLAAAGASTADVVKTSIFLADMSDFAAVNEVYARYFVEPLPARATVAVKELPKSVRVEIDATAYLGS